MANLPTGLVSETDLSAVPAGLWPASVPMEPGVALDSVADEGMVGLYAEPPATADALKRCRSVAWGPCKAYRVSGEDYCIAHKTKIAKRAAARAQAAE